MITNPINSTKLKELQVFSIEIRKGIIRQLGKRGFGHLGGSMSIADILSVLYGLDMNIDPENPQKADRDYLVCSKGHAGPAIYAALALKGFFPTDWLDTLNQPGTQLPSHCDRLKTPGIDVTTGSLGQGLSMACGIAIASRDDKSGRTVYCIIGDGESQEGQIWESTLFAAHQKLSNLVVFLDCNKFQLDGAASDINSLDNIADKFRTFHWSVQEIDGQSHEEIHAAIESAKACSDKPSLIVANTIKGSGCTFALGKLNHHINVSAEEAAEATVWLNEELARLG